MRKRPASTTLLYVRSLEAATAASLSCARALLDGRRVRLRRGRKFRGREAVVDGVILDGATGRVLCCAMVLWLPIDRGHPRRYPNAEAETRTYWPVADLEWIDDEKED